ncbi:MAG: GNAT family N-acetyltransferase [Oligoflexia bacterium]|nr:GNAT family N-acetyltransferase [Oligoflexia bacterium]
MYFKVDYGIKSDWLHNLNSFDIKSYDVYHLPNYANLDTYSHNSIAESFYYLEGDMHFLFPYIKKKIPDSDFYDFETPYGYSGPISTSNNKSFLEKAWNKCFNCLIEKKIIAGLVRFNPFIENKDIPSGSFPTSFDRKIAVIDFSHINGDSYLYDHLHPSNKKSILAAQRKGLSFYIDEAFEQLERFMELYYSTMAKINAEEKFLFSSKYFHSIKKCFEKNSFLVHALIGEKIISSALILSHGSIAHYHLSCSDSNYLTLCPNNIMLHECSRYLKNKGYKYFNLGGGTNNSMRNSLFVFKSKFANQLYDFYIGKMILNKDIYLKICSLWEKKVSSTIVDIYSNHLLKYRYID